MSSFFQQPVKGVELISNVRKNRKTRLLSLWDKAIPKKRFIIETINNQLKSISRIEHARHRSIHGFMLNLMGDSLPAASKKTSPP